MCQYHYRVYIIELKKTVLEGRRFLERNPQYEEGKPCVYVGSTGKTVEQRFEEHRVGYKANRYAKKYGKRLRHGDMRSIRPRKKSRSIEQKEHEVARELQARGWGVWWN